MDSKTLTKEGPDAERYTYGSIIIAELESLISPSCYAMKQNLDFSGEEGEGRMQERCTMFNLRRAKKTWSKSDLNFFVKTLASSLSVDQAKQYVRIFTKDTDKPNTKK